MTGKGAAAPTHVSRLQHDSRRRVVNTDSAVRPCGIENTNGLLRQYLPRTLDFRTRTQADFDAIADKLTARPRQTLSFKTPSHLAPVLTLSNRPLMAPVLPHGR